MRKQEFAYVNGHYGLSLKRGSRLRFTAEAGDLAGKGGTVARGAGAHIMILVDGDLKPSGPYHPTWAIEHAPGGPR